MAILDITKKIINPSGEVFLNNVSVEVDYVLQNISCALHKIQRIKIRKFTVNFALFTCIKATETTVT